MAMMREHCYDEASLRVVMRRDSCFTRFMNRVPEAPVPLWALLEERLLGKPNARSATTPSLLIMPPPAPLASSAPAEKAATADTIVNLTTGEQAWQVRLEGEPPELGRPAQA